SRGTLVVPADFGSDRARGAARTMSVPVPRARAVDGQLAVGDRVDVIASSDAGAWYVATGVEVVGVSGGGGGGALPTTDDHVVLTLAVDEHSALEIARAVSSLDVTVVRATGAAPVAGALPLGPLTPTDAGADGSG